MQPSIFFSIFKPTLKPILKVCLCASTLAVASPLATASSDSELNSLAEYEFDYSADTMDYRNNRLPAPYVPSTYWLLTSNSLEQIKEALITKKQPEKEPIDIWEEIRAGFQLNEFDNHLVSRHEKRFTRNPKQFERILERAATYLPYFLEQTQRYNLPSEIVLLPLVESGYNPRIYSSRGAAGLWQFMPATGRLYGLKQDWWYEGRRDITYSTEAALKHLIYLNKMFKGDWPLTFAAYNAGSNGIKRVIQSNRRVNKPTDFNSLRLNSETRNYFPKLIAVKNIVQNPDAYGIRLPKISTQSPFGIVEFEFQVDLAVLASAIQVDSLQLALLNPGLRRHATPPNGPYRVLVPTNKLHETLSWKQDLHPSEAISSIVHIVRAGDTLSDIALEHSISVASLKTINSKRSNLIRIGEVIRIPVPQATADNLISTTGLSGIEIIHTVVAGESLSQIAKQYHVPLTELRAANGLDPNAHLILIGQRLRIPDGYLITEQSTVSVNANSEIQSRILHSVSKGESLWSIARKYKVRILDILNWNKISRSAVIHPGQNLVIYAY